VGLELELVTSLFIGFRSNIWRLLLQVYLVSMVYFEAAESGEGAGRGSLAGPSAAPSSSGSSFRLRLRLFREISNKA